MTLASRKASLLGTALLAFLITGCTDADDDDSFYVKHDGSRTASGSAYTDSDLGYSLTAPANWEAWVTRNGGSGHPLGSAGALFSPADSSLQNVRLLQNVFIGEVALDPSMTMQQWVDLYLVNMRHESVQTRQGVTVYRVSETDTLAGVIQKRRYLYFQRKSKVLSITFDGKNNEVDTHPHLLSIDSSLTFF